MFLIGSNHTVSIERNAIYTPASGIIINTPKTENSARVIPLLPKVAALLKAYKEQQKSYRKYQQDRYKYERDRYRYNDRYHNRYRYETRYRPVYENNRRDWRRGQVLDRAYRGQGYWVNDYRQYPRLYAPSKNQRWVRVDNDYILVNTLSNVIVSILTGR